MNKAIKESELMTINCQPTPYGAAMASVGVGVVPRLPIMYRLGAMAATMAERGYALQSIALRGTHFLELEQQLYHSPERDEKVRLMGNVLKPTVRYGKEPSIMVFEHVKGEGEATVTLED